MELSSGVSDGFGSVKYSSDPLLLKELYKNTYQFSSAKSYTELLAMSNQLIGEDGKPRSFAEFKSKVDEINSDYNVSYLQAEYQTALKSAQSGKQWQSIQTRKDLFPNLQYKTVGDSRVRDEHAALDGIIRPVDDPFWDIHYPPNGWRCRCRVIQTDKQVTEGENPKVKLDDNFKNNVGKNGVIFKKGHVYFDIPTDVKSKLRPTMNKAIERAPYYKGFTDGNFSVLVHPYADKVDFMANYKAAIKLVEQIKVNVKVRPHLLIGKNPELEIAGLIADVKKPKKINGVKKRLEEGIGQGCQAIYYDLSKIIKVWDGFKVWRRMKGTLKYVKRDMVFYFDDGNKINTITKDEIMNNSAIPKFLKIKKAE